MEYSLTLSLPWVTSFPTLSIHRSRSRSTVSILSPLSLPHTCPHPIHHLAPPPLPSCLRPPDAIWVRLTYLVSTEDLEGEALGWPQDPVHRSPSSTKSCTALLVLISYSFSSLSQRILSLKQGIKPLHARPDLAG
jgi:hypothetical protein